MAIAANQPGHMPQKTILVVEDEEPIRILSEAILLQEGFRVITAENGLEALEKLQKLGGSVDLLITDLSLPGLSGDDLAARARALQPSMAVIFASGSFTQ